jgi:hypothetical protein
LDGQRQIDGELYPHFAALAGDAYWFRNATTVANDTLYAVPAILGGRYPEGRLLPTAQDYPHTVFTLLGSAYDLHVSEAATHLCPAELCQSTEPTLGLRERMESLLSDVAIVYAYILLPADLTTGLPVLTQGWNDFTATTTTAPKPSAQQPTAKTIHESILTELMQSDRLASFQAYVAAIDPAASGSKPDLYFVHAMLPHSPWQYLPSGRVYGEGHIPGVAENGNWNNDEWAVAQAYQHHLLQVQTVDTQLGTLMARLKETGLYDRALIVVVADHGASFQPGHCRRCIEPATIPDIVSIPLIVKLPNQHEGVISDRNVETIDILPTIADALDIPLPWAVDGQSALDPSLPERPEKILVNHKNRFERLVLASVGDGTDATVDRKLALFGPNGGAEKLFHLGRYKQLIGQPVNALAMSGTADVIVNLEKEALLAALDLSTGYIPAEIEGTLRATTALPTPLHLAIAINGSIRAVTQAAPRDGGQFDFLAMAPESAFRPGANTVEVFIVSGDEAQPQVQRTQGRLTRTFSLVRKDGQESLVDSDGHAAPVTQEVNTGWVGYRRLNDSIASVSGWAVDRERMRPSTIIVVFADDTFLAADVPTLSRPDVVKSLNDERVLRSGFKFELPESALDAHVRVFAISEEGMATELHYNKDFLERNRR